MLKEGLLEEVSVQLSPESKEEASMQRSSGARMFQKGEQARAKSLGQT